MWLIVACLGPVHIGRLVTPPTQHHAGNPFLIPQERLRWGVPTLFPGTGPQNGGRPGPRQPESGLAWLGVAWLGLARLGLAWLGLAWICLGSLGLTLLGLAWLGFAWIVLAWLGFTWVGHGLDSVSLAWVRVNAVVGVSRWRNLFLLRTANSYPGLGVTPRVTAG